jgi:hypothetical protein
VADDSGCRRDQLASALESNAVLSDELGRLDRDQLGFDKGLTEDFAN